MNVKTESIPYTYFLLQRK